MVWVLIDASYLGYRALHTVGGLDHDDVPTGVLYGVLMQLRQVCLDPRVRSNKVVVFCDSRTSLRKKAYPEYKWKRTERTEEELERLRLMRVQMDLLTTKILPDIGVRTYRQEGLESDDIIASVADSFPHAIVKGRQAVMITADGDLFQSINENVHWFDPQRNTYYDPAAFLEVKGIECWRWGEVKALSGCKTDCVKGIRGIGEMTAIKFLRGELPPSRKTHQSIVSGKGRAIAKRNRALVVLPHKETKPVRLEEPEYNTEAFFDYCRQFGLDSFIHERQAWLSFFHGTPFRTRRRGE